MKEHCVLRTKIIKQSLNNFWNKGSLASIHIKNVQLLMTEIYETKFDLSPPFMKDISLSGIGYNLSHGDDSQLPKVHTRTYGIETISCLGNRLRSTLPSQTSKHTSYFQKQY